MLSILGFLHYQTAQSSFHSCSPWPRLAWWNSAALSGLNLYSLSQYPNDSTTFQEQTQSHLLVWNWTNIILYLLPNHDWLHNFWHTPNTGSWCPTTCSWLILTADYELWVRLVGPWAEPWSTAIQGQLMMELVQALNPPPHCKNQVNIKRAHGPHIRY